MESNPAQPGEESRGPHNFMLFLMLRGGTRTVLVRACTLIALIALSDWRIEGNIPLGFLYLFPMLLVGGVLSRWQIAVVAALCTSLTEMFDAFDWAKSTGIPRDILIFAAFFCMGLFVYEIVRSRKTAEIHLQRLEQEATARSEAEEQLKVLVESSPAAVFTTNAEGTVLLANEAAHRLFGMTAGALASASIYEFLPSLMNVRAPDEKRTAFRTAMQCRGRRRDGTAFLADMWFSTYRTTAGPRLAAMVVDVSDELRNREETSLHQLLAGSRILVGAVSHEIRNVCGAIAMAHANLARAGALSGSKDFEALGKLIGALERIASMDLRQMADQASSVDLYSLLDEFMIVVGPSLEEENVRLALDAEPGLPIVWADRQSLLQVFLNLTKNSVRAMLENPSQTRRALTIIARRDRQRVVLRFKDTGCGVAHPERLFHPFQQQAQATGLGLYLSRAFMRSFRGDLRYEPEPDGSSFIVELSPAAVEVAGAEPKDIYGNPDPDLTGGRSQPVPRGPQPVAGSRT
jgi:two-component system sensor kinase FixL